MNQQVVEKKAFWIFFCHSTYVRAAPLQPWVVCIARSPPSIFSAHKILIAKQVRPNLWLAWWELCYKCFLNRPFPACFKKNRPTMASFSFIFVFSNTHYNFPTNKCENMSIQNTVPGFELTAFGTWVSSHYHKTKAPALPNDILANPVGPDWNTFGKS